MQLNQIGEELIKAFNDNDLDRLLSFFDPDAFYEFPNLPILQGKKKIQKFLHMVFEEALTDMIISVREFFICQNTIIIEWTNTATTPMGNPYSNSGVFICEIKNGKIQSFREYLDLTPTLQVNRELEAMKAKR